MEFSRGKWNGLESFKAPKMQIGSLTLFFEEVTQESSVAIITFGYVQERFGFFM